MDTKPATIRTAQDPTMQRPISTSTLDDSDFESSHDDSNINNTPARSSHFGNAHPDLPPSYDQSQAEALDVPTPSYPYPPGVVNRSDITVFRTEIPPDPPITVPAPRVEQTNREDVNPVSYPDEKRPIVSNEEPSPQASGLLNEALRFTETPPPLEEVHLALRVPVAVPSLPQVNNGPVKFTRFYATVLDAHLITAGQLVEFIDGLNAICTATSFSSSIYHSRNPSSGYELSRDDSSIPHEDMLSAFLALSNTHFFNPRGLRVHLSDLSQLADMVNMNNAAIRKTVLGEVLRNVRAGVEVPAAANGAAGAASQALVPYIEALTAAVPEPRKHTEALDILANRLAATHIFDARPPPSSLRGAHSRPGSTRDNHNAPGGSCNDGNSFKRQQSWSDWGNEFGKKWEEWGKRFGEKQERYWTEWGRQQEDKWGAWGKQQEDRWGARGEMISAGPPWARGGGGGFRGRQGPFGGGHRGGGPFGFGQQGGPLSGRGGGGAFAGFGRGVGFGRGGFGPFSTHYATHGLAAPHIPPGVPTPYTPHVVPTPPGVFSPHQIPVPIPAPHYGIIPAPHYGIIPGQVSGVIPTPPPIPGAYQTPRSVPRGASHIPTPPLPPQARNHIYLSGNNPRRHHNDNDNNDDDDDDDLSDTASLSSTSSSSSSSDSDATRTNEDPEAIFAAKIASIERMATEAHSLGRKPSSDIDREKIRLIYQAEQEKARAELRIEMRERKSEFKSHGAREWKRGKKAEYAAWKREAKEERRGRKKEGKGEYRRVKGELKEKKRREKEEWRRGKREGKMKVKGGGGARGEGGRGGNDGSSAAIGDFREEDVEAKAKEMLWVVVSNFEG
ncbi:hypothetical protein EJ08DRAFT_699684 [Tothia fuscella]|uniref:Uncharacterized protein n=1 Tax=Tothia fuscella TaxID=1048955 RepID=A0A9P4NLY7_9PEZI|nr:hypothetical protein EJ08DRAFT_699684 [Tothia fuscella]